MLSARNKSSVNIRIIFSDSWIKRQTAWLPARDFLRVLVSEQYHLISFKCFEARTLGRSGCDWNNLI